jgi:hypothetical protein
MSTERDIIIKRLEQKLEERDKQIAEMRPSLKESVIAEIETRFEDKIRLREATLKDVRLKFSEKVNEITEMNKSLRESLLAKAKAGEDAIQKTDARMNRIERRLVELNSSYDGVMKELLDQKSIVQEITSVKKAKKPEAMEEKAPEPLQKKVEVPEKPGKKGEYIIAENYVTKQRKKPAVIEAAEDIREPNNEKETAKPKPKPVLNKTKNEMEGVEITETLKKR